MTATRINANVDDFSVDAGIGDDAKRRLALLALSDKERNDPSMPLVYDMYWDVFTDALTEFKAAREAACRDQLTRDRVMLPRGHWLILGSLSTIHRRHQTMRALNGETAQLAAAGHDRRAILGGGYDGGDPRAAARQIVGSCWPRYRRALTIIHAATDYLRKNKHPGAVDENTSPR